VRHELCKAVCGVSPDPDPRAAAARRAHAFVARSLRAAFRRVETEALPEALKALLKELRDAGGGSPEARDA
jgi:hypothetical protein